MFLSIFDIFKIGIGPSSSHTMGPMVAAYRFRSHVSALASATAPARLSCSVHGSLAFTGHGHATDRAVILGLLGELPESVDLDSIDSRLEEVWETRKVSITGSGTLSFDPARDLIFDQREILPCHSNGMRFRAYDVHDNLILEQVYYSIGGGFVMTEQDLVMPDEASGKKESGIKVPYPFVTAKDMLEMGEMSGLSIAEMKRCNESASGFSESLDTKIDQLWETMNACIERGLHSSSRSLPGVLKITRRAAELYAKLNAEKTMGAASAHQAMEWVSLYAMAVNEENASGGRVVTAPTNGAAGIVPATIRYYQEHCPGASIAGIRDFFLTAAAIGGIIKHNASISGAEVGCQGEVGSASAMAAAGLCCVLGGTNRQIENAAEIALEHHLGMTCDPVAGLVQVPCIERNAFGAVKAITSAALALRGNGFHFVSLDACIKTMYQVGIDMHHRYKETSTGGLAVNSVEC